MRHAVLLTDPKLIITDPARGKRIEARCPGRQVLTVAVDDSGPGVCEPHWLER